MEHVFIIYGLEHRTTDKTTGTGLHGIFDNPIPYANEESTTVSHIIYGIKSGFYFIP